MGTQKLEDVKAIRSGQLKATDIEEEDRDYYLERRYPALETLYQEMWLLGRPKNDVMQALG